MTTPPNAPAEVDVLAFFDDAEKIWTDANTGANADTIGGVTTESVKEACARIEGRLSNVRQARTAVAALLTREAALVAEVDLLRRVQASMATEGVALVAERDALAAEVGALRETVGLFADDAQRWSEVERRFNESKTSAASLVLEGLGLEPTPYRDFAETVDAARAEAGHG